MEEVIEKTEKKPFKFDGLIKQVENLEKANKEQVLKHIVILPELQSYIPPLDGDTLQQLERNILSEGVRDSIILWKQNDEYILIDGHNRYGICQKHNIEFPFKVMEFENIDAVKAFMVKLQLGRRNLTKEQISYFRGLEYSAAKKAHGGLREASNQNEYLPENSETPRFSVGDSTPKKTVEVLAEKHNTSAATIQRDEAFSKGLDLLTEIFRNEVLSGKTKVDKQTIYNLPKVYAKFPEEFKIESEATLHAVYKKYRDSEAKAAALPVSGVVNGSITSGISKFQNLPKREEVSQIIKKATEVGSQEDLLKALDNAGAQVLVEISGRFLLDNNLTFYWKKLRQIDTLITAEFKDYLTYGQAKVIGLFDGEPRESEGEEEIKKLKEEIQRWTDFYEKYGVRKINLETESQIKDLKAEIEIWKQDFQNQVDEIVDITLKNLQLTNVVEGQKKEIAELKQNIGLLELGKEKAFQTNSTDELETLKAELYNVQKSFNASTSYDRGKILKSGLRILRVYEKTKNKPAQIKELIFNTIYNWIVLEEFETNELLKTKAHALSYESNIIFEK